MNANELADIVDRWAYKESAEYLTDAATMLRQQQAEIETLKLKLHTTLTNRDLRTYDGKTEINNEPVAWTQNTFCKYCHRIPSQCCCTPAKTLTDDPLVNFKPVWQEKPELTLTDEEIINLYKETEADNGGIREFAKAILRKAQEK